MRRARRRPSATWLTSASQPGTGVALPASQSNSEATGAPLPVASLFDWLAGKPTPVPGWEADVSQVAEGRLRARRTEPPPPADLRLVFEH